MDLRTRIQTLFKEAEIYRQQGLLEEARDKYIEVTGLLEQNPNIKNRDQLLDAIQKKIKAVDREANELEEALGPEQVASANVQDLVKGFFTAGGDEKEKAANAFKGAIALAQMRQFDRALAEFQRLLSDEGLRIQAAKNILKCHIAISSVDAAIDQYRQWLPAEMFTNEQLEGMAVFFEDLMRKKNVNVVLPRREAPEPVYEPDMGEVTGLKAAPSAIQMAAEAAAEEAAGEDQIEICSLEITPESGPKAGKPIELEVTAQTGNKIHVSVPAKDADYVVSVEVGQRLNKLQFFSHFVMFWGTGIVLAKRKLESGPKKGDINLSIRMESPGTQH